MYWKAFKLNTPQDILFIGSHEGTCGNVTNHVRVTNRSGFQNDECVGGGGEFGFKFYPELYNYM